MKNYNLTKGTKGIRLTIAAALLVTISGLSITSTAQAQTAAQTDKAKVGSTKIWGTVNGVAVEGMVQGPSEAVAPLQIACVFEYTDNDIYNSPPALPPAANGMVGLDKALGGLIQDLRKSGKFAGHAYETILITPPAGKLKAKQLLLIGLGDKTKFNPDMMVNVGQIALRESLKLGVTVFSFASDLKDGGIDSPTAAVASDVVKGIFTEYRTQIWLKNKGMIHYKPLSKVVLLAGQAYFTTAGGGINQAITALK